MKKYVVMLFCLLFLFGCGKESTQPSDSTDVSSAVDTIYAEETGSEVSMEIVAVPLDDDFVRISDHVQGIIVDLKYSTTDNFTGQCVYEFSEGYLRYGTVKKLAAVQSELMEMGLSLKIWDAFRPPQAQFRLWEICPDGNYVSDPNKGFSSHSRGNTVDVTLVNECGEELEMPTGFDDFSKLADRDYSDCSNTAQENALLLENLMIKHGFRPYSGEWWHFTDETAYDPEEVFVPRDGEKWYADCEEFISLRTKPETGSDVIQKIPAGERVLVIGWIGSFAHVQFDDLHGYVLGKYLEPEPFGGA